MVLAALEVIAQEQVKHGGGALGVGGQHLDQAAAVGAHRRQPHHLGVVLAQTFRALDRVLFALNAAQDVGLFRFGVGEEGLILRVDLVQRRFCDIDIALIDEGRRQAVEHRQHEGADLVAVHIGIGTDDDLIEPQVVQIEAGQILIVAAAQLNAAAHDADQVGDDLRLEDAGVVGLQAVQDLAADRHDGLKFRVTALLDRAHSGIALHDIQLTAGGVLGAAVHELLHAVGEIHLRGHRLFDRDARLLGVLAALLIDEHLLAGLFGLIGMLNEVDLDLMLEELGHGLRHKLVRDGLFRLVLIAGAGREAGRDKHQTVLHIGKGDRALVLLVQALGLQPAVDLADEGCAHGAVGASAMLQPAGVVVVFQTLHGVGECERHIHLDLIVRLVGAVAAGGGAAAEMHRRQGLIPHQFVGIVGDAMLVQILKLFGVRAGLVGKYQRNAIVDDSLTAEHILEGFRRDGDVGENLGVGLPAPIARKFFRL